MQVVRLAGEEPVYLVAIAWMYVVLMMAAAEAMAPNGTVLGAVITLIFYGVLPVVVLMYIMSAPMRRRARLRADSVAVAAPDGSGEATGAAVAPERKEP